MAEEEIKTPKKMGGRREGAGRKAKAEAIHRITIRASDEVYNILQMQENMTKYIEDAIREKHRRERY